MRKLELVKPYLGESYTAIGKALGGLSGEAVRKWDLQGVPDGRVRQLAEATGWQVTPHQLRPDMYPHPDDGLPLSMRASDVA
jgi:hypothetical protein